MGAGSKQFETSRIYFQWLNFRGAWPMKLDRRARKWMWGLAVFFSAVILFVYLFESVIWSYGVHDIFSLLVGIFMVCAVFFAMVLPVIYMLVDLLVHVPRAIHDDTESTMLHAIMVTPITTSSMMRDLTAWAIRLNFGHLAPCLLVLLAFLTVNFFDISGYDLHWFLTDFLPVFLGITIVVVVLWHFLLVTGLASAAFPRWFWSTGSSLFFWVVPILSGVIWATYKIMQVLLNHRMELFPRRIIIFGLDYHELLPWIAILTAAILLEIATIILARNLHRLMSRRRAGEWR